MPNREFSKFKFLGERGLTDQEIETIAQWVEAGMPEGDPAIEAPIPKFAKGSALGNPDLTLRADEPYKIKGSNEDEYRVFVLPTGLSEDRDLVGVEFRPGNRAILHHALLAFDTTGQARESDASDPLVGYEVFGGFGLPVSPKLSSPVSRLVRFLYVYRKGWVLNCQLVLTFSFKLTMPHGRSGIPINLASTCSSPMNLWSAISKRAS